MPLEAEAIQEGKCYAAGAENYRVLSITRKIVTYQAWPKGGKLHPLRINVGLKAFAAAVKKEIVCPDFSST